MIDTRAMLATLDEYYDTVPRSTATVEEVGPFTNFIPSANTRWPFYARPRLGLDAEVTAEDVRRVLARRLESGLPRNLEWVAETTPSLLAAVTEAVGDRTARLPLLVRSSGPAPPEQTRVAVLTPNHPDLAPAVAAIGASFVELDSYQPADLSDHPEMIAKGDLIMVAAYDPVGRVVGGGSTFPRGQVTEIMGVGIVPRARRTGLGTAVTQALVREALAAGISTVFLSAGSHAAASIYRRAGFVDVGTACILELDG